MSVPASEPAGAAPCPRVNVLLVDDEPANLLALEAILEGPGLNLVRASSGEQALQILREDDFGAVLLDIRMSGLDGFETARRIRAQERSRQTPILFLTAYESDRFPVVEAYKLGAVDYLVKPLVPEILAAKVAVFVELFRKTELIRRQGEELRAREREALQRRAEQEVSRRSRQLEVLSRASQQVNAVLDVGVILRTLVAAARELAEAESGTAGLLLGGRFAFTEYNERGTLHPIEPAYLDTQERGVPGWVLRHRVPYLTNDAAADPVVRPEVRRVYGVHSLVAVPVFDRQGRLIACFVLHNKQGGQPFGEEDVTALEGLAVAAAVALENTRLYERLRESESRHRQLADNLPAGFIYQIVHHPQRGVRFSYVSGGVEQLLGITPAEVMTDPLNLYGLIHPDDLARVREREEHSLRTGTPFDCQFRSHSRHGEPRWLHCRSAPRALSGAVTVWDGIAVDITEQRLAEQHRRESEELFRTLADSIPQLAWMARPDGWVFWYNRRWYQYTGATPEQLQGWGWQSFHDPAELPRVLDGFRAAVAAGEPWEDLFPLRRRDGVMRWHLARAVPIRDEQGRITRWLGTNTDITERLEMERALKEADRRKDEFLAMLAHELRNPLAPIRNSLHILRLRGGDWQTVEQVREMMERQIGHMARIVDDLLDVSRITRGKLVLHRQRLDLARFARTSAEDHRRAFETRGVALNVHTPQTPVWVNADPTRLAQIADNLLTNALKFTGEGGTVDVEIGTDEAGQALLTVQDTGAGIDGAMLPRLFAAFSQAEQTLDRSQGGLGLGLAIVKGLAELHGGRVEAHSEGLGRGARFRVYLPCEAELPALSDRPAPPVRNAPHLRVLVVEDSRDAADSLRMLLEMFGYEVSVAYSGPEGVQAAQQVRPDVVVCDLGLPGLDGFGVARALRSRPETAAARLIAVTGYGRDEDRQRALEAGFDDHLTKPVDPERLLDEIGKA
jgi:PAS domain S-box-containing protein